MPCLFVALIFFSPRVAIVLLYLFTNFFTGVYHDIIIPLVGFFLLPLTLLVYTYFRNVHRPSDGIFLISMGIAVILDLGLLGHGGHRYKNR